jgi:hypothetical protein
MDKIRDFFGLPKEANVWDEKDIKIIFISIFFYMGIAGIPYLLKSEDITSGTKLTTIILLLISLYSFISFIVTSIAVNKKRGCRTK